MQERATQQTLATLYTLKRELAFIRRTINPRAGHYQHAAAGRIRTDSAQHHPYLRDLADHVNQVIETLESYRELIAGLMDVYYSIVNNRMNSVMKTLTIVSAIFIPLTFIAGIYGMNFDNMPELRTRQPVICGCLFAMAAIAVAKLFTSNGGGWM